MMASKQPPFVSVHRWLLLTVTGWGLVGCAPPCHDDGLAQGGCPEALSNPGATGTSSSGGDGMMSEETGTGTGQESGETSFGSGGGSGAMCPELKEILVPQTPTFQLVIDQSGSMDQPFGMQSRWDSMRETLVGTDGIVTRLQSSIRFGVSLYQNPAESMTCPDLETLSPQLDAQDEIFTLLDSEVPGGDTPTGEALTSIVAELQQEASAGDKVIVLVTDGEPDTCAIRNPMTDEEIEAARAASVTAVEQAFEAGIQTFVISVGAEIAQEHLQAIANAGVGVDVDAGQPNADYYQALEPAALVESFDTIISGVSCDLELPSPLQQEFAPTCTTTINGEEVLFDDPNGWRLSTETTIELVGTACDSVREGVVVVEMTCTCTL